MINGAWDFVQIAIIAWSWVETKGRTLEEIDERLDGAQKHVIIGVDPEQANTDGKHVTIGIDPKDDDVYGRASEAKVMGVTIDPMDG